MPRRSRSSSNTKALSVTVHDRSKRQSRTITVYTDGLEDVAREIERVCSLRWRTTKLSDRRHRRRLG